eukprot:6082009-Pyramimonas_sp.AAC.1
MCVGENDNHVLLALPLIVKRFCKEVRCLRSRGVQAGVQRGDGPRSWSDFVCPGPWDRRGFRRRREGPSGLGAA